MRTIWHSLAWKEWHEHKWKLAALTTVLASVSSLTLMEFRRESLMVAALIAVFCIAPLAIFVGTGAAAGERSRGTMAFTRALPAPMWIVGLQKLLFGLLTCVVPVLVVIAALGAVYLVRTHWQLEPAPRFGRTWEGVGIEIAFRDWLVLSVVAGVAMSASFFLWTAAFGVNRKDEISAGAYGLLPIGVWWLALILGPDILRSWGFSGNDWLHSLFMAASPGGLALQTISATGDAGPTIIAGIAISTFALLGSLYVVRFAWLPELGVTSPSADLRVGHQSVWLGPPRSSRLAAIAWKQFRESSAIAIAGFVGVISMSVLVYLSDPERWDLRSAAAMAAGIMLVFGVCVTLVIGIGLFVTELTPRVNDFWRSRPVDPNMWFWAKYATGLGVLAITYGVPLLLAGAVVGFTHPDVKEALPFATVVPLYVFATAVMMTCLVRHAIYAAILSVGLMYLAQVGYIGVRVLAILAGLVNEPEGDWANATSTEVLAVMLVTIFVSTIIAWLATRNDWGWKKG